MFEKENMSKIQKWMFIFVVASMLLSLVVPRGPTAIAASVPPVQSKQSDDAVAVAQQSDAVLDYWEVPVLLPVIDSNTISAAAAQPRYVPAYIKFYNRNKRIVVQLICGDVPLPQATVLVSTSVFPNEMVNVGNCTGDKTVWERTEAFVSGETLKVEVDSGELHSVVKLTTGEKSPTWVVVMTGAQFCFNVRGHYDPHVFTQFKNPVSGQVVADLYKHIEETDWNWQMAAPTNLPRFDVIVEVTTEMQMVGDKPTPAGNLRARYEFLSVPNHCFIEQPGIAIEKLINGLDADEPNGSDVPNVLSGETVTYTFVVSNTGNVDLHRDEITVTDDSGLVPVLVITTEVNGDNILSVGEVWHYQGHAQALNLDSSSFSENIIPGCDPNSAGELRKAHRNIATVTARGLVDEDPAHYCNPVRHGIDIEKYINGADADDPNGADVNRYEVGAPLTVTFQVRNDGNITYSFEQVILTDDFPGLSIAWQQESDGGADGKLSPGETWTYVAYTQAADLWTSTVGTIIGGCDLRGIGRTRPTHRDVATVTVPGATDFDPAHYCNSPKPSLKVTGEAKFALQNDGKEDLTNARITGAEIICPSEGVTLTVGALQNGTCQIVLTAGADWAEGSISVKYSSESNTGGVIPPDNPVNNPAPYKIEKLYLPLVSTE